MAVTTNQATVVCQSGCQPLIRSPLRRGGKTGAFNALEQYGTGAQWHSSSVQEISKNVARRTRTTSQARPIGALVVVNSRRQVRAPDDCDQLLRLIATSLWTGTVRPFRSHSQTSSPVRRRRLCRQGLQLVKNRRPCRSTAQAIRTSLLASATTATF